MSKPHKTWLASGLTSPTALPRLLISFCSDSSPFCFPLQDSGAGPGRKVQRGARRQSLVRGGLGEPEGQDGGPQLREVCAQGLPREPRKG